MPGRESEPSAGHSYARHTREPCRSYEARRGVNREYEAAPCEDEQEEAQGRAEARADWGRPGQVEKDVPNRSPASGRQGLSTVLTLYYLLDAEGVQIGGKRMSDSSVGEREVKCPNRGAKMGTTPDGERLRAGKGSIL